MIQIKNWKISEVGIAWVGQPKMNFFIDLNQLVGKGQGSRADCFDIILHASEVADVSEDDIYALNTALFYAVEHFKLDVPKGISFISTVIQQQIIIGDKENTDL